VTARSEREAFAWRAALRAGLEDSILPAFGRAFDDAAPDEAVVRIPRLELRLRVANPDELGAALSEALSRELKALPPAPPRPAAADWHELLLGYLENGTLAWHAAHRDPADVVAPLRAALLAALEPITRGGISRGAPFARVVQYYFRLLQLLPAERWSEAAKYLPGNDRGASSDPAAASPAAALAALIGAPASLPRHVAHSLAAVVLAAVTDSRAAGQALREELAAAVDIGPASAEQAVASRLAALPAPVARFFTARLGDFPAEGERLPGVQRGHAVPAPRPGHEDRRAPEEFPQRGGARTQETPSFALAANNAGLVLLHPFLPRLFEGCELYRRPDLTSLPRAAALLHWLAAGGEEVHEFELGFVKLLLGLHPESPLAVGPGLLGARERDEGEELLRAVIGHWAALRGTSVEGLRLSFLQRRGALREEDTGWHLHLEPEAFDVLLNHLPWGIGTVKLPWMTRPLFINWPMP
jgi:hypothetical protein